MIADGDFYDLSSPTHIQQGDVFPNVPLISPPPSDLLLILRDEHGNPWTPQHGPLTATSEQFLPNVFEGPPEYVVTSAERGLAAILTQTCNLVHQEQWLVAPLLEIEGTKVNAGNLFSDKYANLFGMRKHPYGYFEDGFLDLGRCFVVRRESIALKNRVACLTLAAQNSLTDKVAGTLSRVWGYSPDEIVPKTGKYRCVRCFNFYGLANPIKEFTEGQKFPECSDCSEIRKHAQWRLLRKHERY